MRPQLVGFIKENLPGFDKPCITGIRLCDLDSILRYKGGRYFFLCSGHIPDDKKELKQLLFHKKLSGPKESIILPGDQSVTNHPVIMDATVESVVKQLQSGLKISGLTFDASKVKTRLEEGLEGDMAPLYCYPYKVGEQIKNNDCWIMLDYRRQFEKYIDNRYMVIAGFMISFNGDIDCVLYREKILSIDSTPNIRLSNVGLFFTNDIYNAVTYVTRNELAEARELGEQKCVSLSKAVYDVILRNNDKTLGFPGASLEEFLYLSNRVSATHTMNKAGAFVCTNDSELIFSMGSIETLYMPDKDLRLRLERPSLDEPVLALKKIIGSPTHPFSFVGSSNYLAELTINLEEIEFWCYGKISEMFNYQLLEKEDTKISKLPKLTIHDEVVSILTSFNGIDVSNYSDGILDLSNTKIDTIQNSFRGVKGIRKVILPESLIYMSDSFCYMPDLEEIDASRCTKLLKLYNVVCNCPNIKQMHLPPNINSIIYSVMRCPNLTKVYGFESKELDRIYGSFIGTAITEVLIKTNRQLNIECSFRECSLVTVKISGKSTTDNFGNVFDGCIRDSFSDCENLTDLELENIGNIHSSFNSLDSLDRFPILENVKFIEDSFHGIKLNSLTLSGGIKNIFRCFRHSEINTVDSFTKSSSLYHGNFIESQIERFNVHARDGGAIGLIEGIRFLDFKNRCNFLSFEDTLSNSVEFLILPDCIRSIHFRNISASKYLRAIYIPQYALFNNKSKFLVLGERTPGGALILVHKDAPALRFIQSKGFKHQVVESQEEAREIIEEMYQDRLIELGKAAIQVKKLQLTGVEGEMLDPKLAVNYSKIKRIEAYLKQPFDPKDLIPLSDDNLKFSTPRKDFMYFNIHKDIHDLDPDIDAQYRRILGDTPITQEKSPIFRALLHLFTHLGVKSEEFFNLQLKGAGAPEIDNIFKMSIIGSQGTVENFSQDIILTKMTHKRRFVIPSGLAKHSDIRNIIFVEDNNILWAAPICYYVMERLSDTKLAGVKSVSKLLAPNDTLTMYGSDKTVMIGYTELSKEVGGEFKLRFLHEHIVVNAKRNNDTEGEFVFYSLLSGMIITAKVISNTGIMTQIVYPSSCYLQVLEETNISSIKIIEVYGSLDEFKLKNEAAYLAMKEFIHPKRYLDSQRHSFDLVLNPNRPVSNTDYDIVEPCYEFTLAQYLVRCRVQKAENLHKMLLDNLFASRLFIPKKVRRETLRKKFDSQSITLFDGTILTQFELLYSSVSNPGIKFDELPKKAKYFIVLTSTLDELETTTLTGNFSYLPLIKPNCSLYAETPLVDSIIKLGAPLTGSTDIKYVQSEEFNSNDFTILYSEGMIGDISEILIMVNNKSGIPFIGLKNLDTIKTLFRLKSLDIPYSSWEDLMGSRAEYELTSLARGTLKIEASRSPICILHNLILHGVTREDLCDFNSKYLDIIATQPYFAKP